MSEGVTTSTGGRHPASPLAAALGRLALEPRDAGEPARIDLEDRILLGAPPRAVLPRDPGGNRPAGNGRVASLAGPPPAGTSNTRGASPAADPRPAAGPTPPAAATGVAAAPSPAAPPAPVPPAPRPPAAARNQGQKKPAESGGVLSWVKRFFFGNTENKLFQMKFNLLYLKDFFVAIHQLLLSSPIGPIVSLFDATYKGIVAGALWVRHRTLKLVGVEVEAVKPRSTLRKIVDRARGRGTATAGGTAAKATEVAAQGSKATEVAAAGSTAAKLTEVAAAGSTAAKATEVAAAGSTAVKAVEVAAAGAAVAVRTRSLAGRLLGTILGGIFGVLGRVGRLIFHLFEKTAPLFAWLVAGQDVYAAVLANQEKDVGFRRRAGTIATAGLSITGATASTLAGLIASKTLLAGPFGLGTAALGLIAITCFGLSFLTGWLGRNKRKPEEEAGLEGNEQAPAPAPAPAPR